MELKFGADGLIPAVVQDYFTKRVLTVAYMSRESLDISIAEGRTCFFSRSRQALWRKGETSGNVQQIVSIRADCDGDALLIEVVPAGPACHTGEDSCFFEKLYQSDERPDFSLDALFRLIEGRKKSPVEGSYTSYLFGKGIDKVLKKVGEECTEVIVAGKGGDRGETVFELADLIYHLMVLMAQMDIEPRQVFEQLASRHVVDSKVKQEKMR
ncbi:MAG: bifunctional phosphoribosyl-AMP cyclohydrolase/phosphoribosyl-ATP diphosphatase HisIE [Clostridiales bacterium]|nr:bifunctional phosphoribosyl-AMP cyclohydrolase/phosphoribosyl-ATP diphosphatase HisIE [Clostridiales bacterium]